MNIYRSIAPVAGQVQRRPARRGMRNWQKFMLCYSFCMAGGALLLYDLAGVLTALVGLAIWLLTALIVLAIAGRKGRL